MLIDRYSPCAQKDHPEPPTILVLKNQIIILFFLYNIVTLLNKVGIQGSTDGTIGKTIGTNGNANGTIGSSNGTIGKPVLSLVNQWCHW